MNRKEVGIIVAGISLGILVSNIFLLSFRPQLLLNWRDRVILDFEVSSIHCHIRIWDDNQLILDEYHSGAVTDIGDNQTLYWIFGDQQMSEGPYSSNCTYIGIGDQGTLNPQSTILPGEWNRTLASLGPRGQSWQNISCIIYPDDQGPYTADCLGIYWASSGNCLWAYDTFSEKTGIDETFTINVEFEISVSHA